MNDKKFKKIVRTEISKIGQALSDPNRVAILDILSQGEKNVEQLTFTLNLNKGIVSHHLQALKNANVVASRKQSRYVFYSMSESALNIWRSINENSQALSSEITVALSTFVETAHDFEVEDYHGLVSRIQEGDVILIDVRPKNEFDIAHFPGALSVPLEEVENFIGDLSDDARNKLRKNSSEIIAYCRGPLCLMAENAVNILRSNNFQAYRWKEGVLDWTDQDFTNSTNGSNISQGAKDN